MPALLRPGRIIFGIGFIGLSILCILSKDFIVGRPPAWPATFTMSVSLGYITAVLLVLAAIAIIAIEQKGAAASLLIALLILVLSVPRHMVQFMNDWSNAYKTLALLGGTLIMAGSFLKDNAVVVPGWPVHEPLRKTMVTTGCLLVAVFFISSGYAHFKFADFIENFIPAYIPFRAFWTYFTGICLIAGGIGIVIPATRRPAAMLSGFMVLGWFLLLHIPRFIANTKDASDRLGLCESFIFVGIFFVLSAISVRHER